VQQVRQVVVADDAAPRKFGSWMRDFASPGLGTGSLDVPFDDVRSLARGLNPTRQANFARPFVGPWGMTIRTLNCVAVQGCLVYYVK
jgi:hypothetical protein